MDLKTGLRPHVYRVVFYVLGFECVTPWERTQAAALLRFFKGGPHRVYGRLERTERASLGDGDGASELVPLAGVELETASRRAA
jgi:hypothetical protein